KIIKKIQKFFETLFFINFVVGFVTGIFKNFNFGLTWWQYSRFFEIFFGRHLLLKGYLPFLWNRRLLVFGFLDGIACQRKSIFFRFGLFRLERFYLLFGFYRQMRLCSTLSVMKLQMGVHKLRVLGKF